VPSAESAPFWDGLAHQELRLRWCTGCGRFEHPRALRCPECHEATTWRAVSGRATVASWTVVHRPFAPGFEVPYVVAQVAPVEQPDLLLDTELLARPDELSLGSGVDVVFRDDERGFSVHAFRPSP
jgi:uncharacterized OB-fold protein